MDNDTLQFYRDNARSYADWAKAPSTRLVRFLALLPRAGSVLELGCGAGNHSAEMLAAGFAVRPFGALIFGRFGDMIGRLFGGGK